MENKSSEFFQKNKYVHIKNLLPVDICHVATQYSVFQMTQNFEPETGQTAQVPGTHGKYGDPLMETLLLMSTPYVQANTGLELIPTYSYYRLYKPGDELHKHKDRPACEITATITLGWGYKDTEKGWKWQILLTDTNGEQKSFSCDLGDGVIYRGLELEHWREPFTAGEGSFQAQVFLHYVDANGPYAKEHAFDGRPGVGFPEPK